MRLAPPVTALSFVFAAIPAKARPSQDDVGRADALFQAAKQAMARGDYDQACPGFLESQRLDPAAGTLLNLAECESSSGKLVEAVAHFQEAKSMLTADDFRVSFAERRIGEVRSRTPLLTLRLASKEPADGVDVVCDGAVVSLERMGQPTPVDPGGHVCIVRRAGRAESRVEITVTVGESRVADLVVPPPMDASADTTVESAHAKPDRGSAGATQRTLGLVVGAVGVATLATGAVFGLLAKRTYDSATPYCPGDACTPDGLARSDRAHTQATIASGAFIAGGALLVTGGVIYLTAPRSHPAVAVRPQIGTHAMGWEIGGRF
jgi:serine/threonine-protein kinase